MLLSKKRETKEEEKNRVAINFTFLKLAPKRNGVYIMCVCV
jgi:hypothetical protein